MENTSPSQNLVSKYAVPGAAIALIAVAIIMVYSSKKTTPETSSSTATPAASMAPAMTSPTTTESEAVSSGSYKDGVYEADGTYLTPGGEQRITIAVTLKDNVVTDSTFTSHAEGPASVRFQGEFGDNYKPMVVGKNVNELQLTKVSGSSLTPQGFMNALEKIKAEAQS
jgi:uncharacterized protein with FMN-binding domain